ncbi:MAG: hypothetical protein FJZ56_04270 [Chlamydiae bacterium]|nr:hypothetical protein [Chlamydiota bacterium]
MNAIIKYFLLFTFFFSLEASERGKILICGVCKNVEEKLPFIMESMTKCGEAYDDYRIIIYENNSYDKTQKKLLKWAKKNPKVTIFSEFLGHKELLSRCPSQKVTRTEVIAMARNRVLEEALSSKYQDFDFVLMADMDFGELWNIDQILKTTGETEIEWDGVFANGLLPDGRFYDLFAFRAKESPLGPEMLGKWWWDHKDWFSIPKEHPWHPVYSAFNGLAIYKRASLKKSRYSGVVTHDVDIATKRWLDQARIDGHPYAAIYDSLKRKYALASRHMLDTVENRRNLPHEIIYVLPGSKTKNRWLIRKKSAILPEICEHVALHASMSNKGFDRFYINPGLITHYHE